jgi:hypothetical protein
MRGPECGEDISLGDGGVVLRDREGGLFSQDHGALRDAARSEGAPAFALAAARSGWRRKQVVGTENHAYSWDSRILHIAQSSIVDAVRRSAVRAVVVASRSRDLGG